jgi:hypothetical protein
MSDPIEDYLSELRRRLRFTPRLRERMLEEVREHLEEAAAERRQEGLDPRAAALGAITQFGSPRGLARALVPQRRRVLVRAAVALVGACLVGGLAVAHVSGPTNVVGLVTPTKVVRGRSGPILSGLGGERLVSLDPTTLAPIGTGVPLQTGFIMYLGGLPPWVGLRAPDGQHLGVIGNGAVQLYALRPLRLSATLRFAPASPRRGPHSIAQREGTQNVVRAGGWLTGGRIALLVQHQAPPYASRITSRTLTVLDAASHRVVQRRIALRGTVMGFASAADHLVALACQDGRSILFVAEESTAQTWTVRLGLPCGHQAPSTVAIRADGTQAAVVGGDLVPVRVDLTDRSVHRLRALTSSTVRPVARGRLAITWVGDSLAVTGARYAGRRHLKEDGLGITLLDPTDGATRTISRDGSDILVVGDTFVVAGFAADGSGRGTGVGLTGYSGNGTRLWHADGSRLVWPFETGQRVYAPRPVKRHTIVDVFDLRTGRAYSSLFQRGTGVRPLTGVVDLVGN